MLQLLYHHHKNVFEIITFRTHFTAIVGEAFVLFARCLRTSANHLFFIGELKRLLKPSPGAGVVQRLRSFVIFCVVQSSTGGLCVE